MKALLLTNEYPPHVYGGAGVHVEYLARELAHRIQVEVRCFGDQVESGESLQVQGHAVPAGLVDRAPQKLRSPLGTLARGISFNAHEVDADVVHCHTWYSHFGGILAKLLYGTPLVITTHSLEPLRPWKREQLGRGYDLSSWLERTALQMADAVVAVSEGTRADILRLFDLDPRRVVVIPNGIDTDQYRPVEERDTLDRLGIPADLPYVLFVGRIARQKGIMHLVRAVEHLDPGTGVVLCAGQPDTEEIAREMQEGVASVQARRDHVWWIQEMVSKRTAIQLYSHAAVFCCPSIYEPFGIINLEAMACRTPVVASAVGGIPEIVRPEKTGLLVSFEQETQPPFEARHPERFAADLAHALNRVAADAALRESMGRAGRERAEQVFSWSAIAGQVVDLYQQIANKGDS
jgi:glycogen synthase